MTSTRSTAPWRHLSGELVASVDRDFERAMLPLLRAFWPFLVRPRGMSAYDNAGVDIAGFTSNDELEIVVQCKGLFASEGLLDNQYAQFRNSISSFLNSPLKCNQYIIVHNCDGRNRSVAAKIDADLAKLIESGKAQEVRQWDRDTFLKAFEERLRAMVMERLYEQTQSLLNQIDEIFEHGRSYIENVPVTKRKLILRPGQRPSIKDQKPSSARSIPIAETIWQSGSRNWSLLTGLFGTGKTSAALHAASLRPEEVIYVHAGSIEPRHGEGGTNIIMSRIVEAQHVFEEFEQDERGIFERLSGPILRGVLSANQSTATLIIDALDENRSLSSPHAITVFASTLAELRCNIVFTTREEHFRATFGNFDHMFEELSTKGGGFRNIRLLELDPWGNEEVYEFVSIAARNEPESSSLSKFRETIAEGKTGGWDPALLRHPFFLRMIVELVAEGQEPSNGKVEILAAWSWTKLVRDLKSDRVTPVPVGERNTFLEKMEFLMEAVASEMIEENDGRKELMDSISSSRVIAVAEKILESKPIELGSALSVTLLMPAAVRFKGSVPVKFIHRTFQEFYLARYLKSNNVDPAAYPAAVRQLFENMN